MAGTGGTSVPAFFGTTGREDTRMIGAWLAVEKCAAWVSALLLAATGVFLSWEVVSRYFFNAPTIWAAEISQLCLIWAVPLAMAWALSARRHIKVDAATRLLPDGARAWAEIGSLLVVLAFALSVAWFGWGIFWDSFERGRTTGTMLDLPAWINELSVPFGFAMLAVSAVANIEKIRREGAPHPDEGIHE